jgi:hypothetical protein
MVDYHASQINMIPLIWNPSIRRVAQVGLNVGLYEFNTDTVLGYRSAEDYVRYSETAEVLMTRDILEHISPQLDIADIQV